MVLIVQAVQAVHAEDSGTMREGVQMLFDIWDSNSDGFLSPDEENYVEAADQVRRGNIDLMQYIRSLPRISCAIPL